jgi:hypothetical protein
MIFGVWCLECGSTFAVDEPVRSGKEAPGLSKCKRVTLWGMSYELPYLYEI